MKQRLFSSAIALSLGAVACGGAATKVDAARGPSASPGSTSCARRHPGVGGARTETPSFEGSSVALARLDKRTIAYVADADGRMLRTIDVDAATALATTPLDAEPAQVLVLADGRVAVTLRDQNKLAIFEPADAAAPLGELCRVDVPVEPFGLAATPDDRSVLVTSVWDRTLSVLDAETMRPRFAVNVPREPRAVLVDEDGSRAFVAHVVGGKMSVIDLSTDKHEVREIDLRVKRVSTLSRPGLRSGAQGFALAKAVVEPKQAEQATPEGKPNMRLQGPKDPKPAVHTRVYAPMVTVEPGDPNSRTAAYYGEVFDGVAKEAPIVSVIDTESERSLTRSVMSLGTRMEQECILPRSAAVRAASATLLVTCLGIDSLVELDTRGFDPARLERRRWRVPGGPTGVAVDNRGQRAIVWSQFERAVSVVDLAAPEDKPVLKSVAMETDKEQSAYARGRRLFHTTDDPRISSDGSACASCHPDGREDALTWSTPDGPRQTIMLAGRLDGTGPYGWMGKHDTLHTYVTNTFTRLGGTGVTGDDLDALIAYLRKLPGPSLRTGGSPLVARGRDLFFDSEAGCSNCHVGATGTDSVHHNVNSKATADVITDFDTPSLRFVGGSAPYFHDGRYKTLRDLIEAPDHAMGFTAHLSRRDTAALEAYLETL